jgi:hypothetical protein
MYIPNSNIIETGYDQNNRFVIIANNQIYKGYWHKDSKGKYWSGKEHTNESLGLRDTTFNGDITLDYISKNNQTSYGFTKRYKFDLNSTLYKNEFVKPTENDYIVGYYTRYIAQLKASTQPYIIELSKENYTALIEDIPTFRMYNTVSLLWKLTGPKYDIIKNNIRVESGIVDTNLRSIQHASKTISDVSKLLTDPLQFVAK